jgi:hypothetical protein
MVVRLVRAGVGALLLLIAVPLAFAGGGLWVAMEHRAADKTFTARLERVHSDGHAVVVPDVDALLRADAPFARGGQTTLSLSALGSGGPLFIGLGPDGDVERYLDGLAQSRLTRVRLARGPLPVEVHDVAIRPAPVPPTPPAPVDATGAPIPVPPAPAAAPLPAPAGQLFWLARGTQVNGAAQLTWSPSAMRGRHLALVVMNADGAAGLDLALTARLAPAWVAPTTGGLLMLGTALFLLALLTLAWPQGRGAEPAVLPTLPSQPTSAARGRSMLRRNLAGPKDQLAWMFNQTGKPPRDVEVTAVPATTETIVVVETAVMEAPPEPTPATEPTATAEPTGKVETTGDMAAESGEPAADSAAELARVDEAMPAAKKMVMASEAVLATLADVLAAADKDAADETAPTAGHTPPDPASATGSPEEPKPSAVEAETGAPSAEPMLAESELDRPAPVDAELDPDDRGPFDLPPLPAMPAIELQFTWAPIALDEADDRDPANSGSTARS